MHPRNPAARLVLLPLLVILACGSNGPPLDVPGSPREIAGTQVRMDFTRAEGFYTAPFPSDELVRSDGRVDLRGFPNPDRIAFVDHVLDLLDRESDGFGASSAIYFRLTGPVRSSGLPDVYASLDRRAPVFLLGVDPDAPDYLRRYPVDVMFEEDGGPFGAPNLLSLLPLQGIPLRPRTMYAAVVLRALADAEGRPLGVSLTMARIAAGVRPDGLDEETFGRYRAAVAALAAAGIERGRLAGLAVFTMGGPTEQLDAFRASVLEGPLPEPNAPFARNEVFDGFCVYETTIHMPVFQQGVPPFVLGGGGWAADEAGRPILQGTEEANFVVTLPRTDMPEEGFPVVVFSRTGGGGERPLVDRGPRAEPGGEPVEPGTGPALHFARAGFAGASVDGPHGGLRNITGGDEQLLIFNILNPTAMRDNIRQSALEIVLTAHILDDVRIDASDCPGLVTPGGGPVRFDTETLVLMGHSMGATILQPALAAEPRFRAAIMSGAGGSWIENLIHKESPFEVRPLAELILNYHQRGRTLHAHDPAVTLVQWAGEPADAPVYNRRIAERPPADRPDLLMLQGIVDTYILPPIANATSLSFGLDLAGEPLDADHPELARFRPLEPLLRFSGARRIDLPASGNAGPPGGPARTAVVVQHPEGPVEDGHEVVFQTDPPKHQYRCFLQTLAAGGVPVVPIPGGVGDACH